MYVHELAIDVCQEQALVAVSLVSKRSVDKSCDSVCRFRVARRSDPRLVIAATQSRITFVYIPLGLCLASAS